MQGEPLELVNHPVHVTLFREQKVNDNYEAILMSNEVRSIASNAMVRNDGTRYPNPNSLMLPKNNEEDWTCFTDTPASLPEKESSAESESVKLLDVLFASFLLKILHVYTCRGRERKREEKTFGNGPLFFFVAGEWSQSSRLDFMNIGFTILIAIVIGSIWTIVLFNIITRSIRSLLEKYSHTGPPRTSEAPVAEESDQADKTTSSKKKKRKPKSRKAEAGEDQRVARADGEEFRIGVIELSSKILGKGSAGTVVYQVSRQRWLVHFGFECFLSS